MDPAKTIGVDYLKLENFDKSNFNTLCLKVIFKIQLLKIYYVISEEEPNFEENLETEASTKWDDHFYKSYLLICTYHLVNVCCNKPSAKDIWNALEEQYNDKEKLSKSHLIDKFLDFKFDYDIEVLPQVKELEKFIMKLNHEKITLYNTFISGAIVNKLSPS